MVCLEIMPPSCPSVSRLELLDHCGPQNVVLSYQCWNGVSAGPFEVHCLLPATCLPSELPSRRFSWHL